MACPANPLTATERTVLEKELAWLLREGVPEVLQQLRGTLQAAAQRLAPGGPSQQEAFRMGAATPPERMKALLRLQGDALCQADVSLAMPLLPRSSAPQRLHFRLRDGEQCKLQQVQDCRNYLRQADQLLGRPCHTGAHVLQLLDRLMLRLTRARARLTTPAALTLPQIASGGLMRALTPAPPRGVLLNVYLNLSKLTLEVYLLRGLQPGSAKTPRRAPGCTLHPPGATFEVGGQRFEVTQAHKAECLVPWLQEMLVRLTVALQLCQQTKDKISVFNSYWGARPN